MNGLDVDPHSAIADVIAVGCGAVVFGCAFYLAFITFFAVMEALS